MFALEAGADEAGGERPLKLFADAEQFGARGAQVFLDERVPVRGNLDRGGWLAQRFWRTPARERFDAGRVEFPLGDESVAVEAERLAELSRGGRVVGAVVVRGVAADDDAEAVDVEV